MIKIVFMPVTRHNLSPTYFRRVADMSRRAHVLALLPYRDHDDDITAGDEKCGDDE